MNEKNSPKRLFKPSNAGPGAANNPSIEDETALETRVILDFQGVENALTRIAHEIVERNQDSETIYLVGVPNGGVPLARYLSVLIEKISGRPILVGILDTTLYRDDVSDRG